MLAVHVRGLTGPPSRLKMAVNYGTLDSLALYQPVRVWYRAYVCTISVVDVTRESGGGTWLGQGQIDAGDRSVRPLS